MDLMDLAATRAALPLVLLAAACGGDHHGAAPTTTAIAPVTVDALYVVNGDDGSITVIDAAGGTVLGAIALDGGAFPHHLYLSADRREMYLAIPGGDLSGGHSGGDHGGAGYVMRLDAATGETLAVAGLAAGNHNAAPAPGGTVWTTQMTEPGAVLVLDAETLDEVARIAVGALPAEVTLSADGGRAFAANGGDDSVTAIDTATLEVLATIPVGDNPVGAWPAGDGLLYVDNEVGGSLSVIDPASLEVVRTFDLGFTPAMATVVGDEVLVTDVDGGRVVFLDAATGDAVDELATGAGAHAMAVAPDGTVWVTNQGAGTVTHLDPATRTALATIAVGAAPNGIVYRVAP